MSNSRCTGIRASAPAVVAIVALGFCSCAVSGPTYSVLAQDVQAEDALPEALPDYAGDEADLASARFVGEHDGSDLWLARAHDESRICLLAYADDDAWVLGCSGAGEPLGIGGVAGTFKVVPDGEPGPDGAVQISENLYGY